MSKHMIAATAEDKRQQEIAKQWRPDADLVDIEHELINEGMAAGLNYCVGYLGSESWNPVLEPSAAALLKHLQNEADFTPFDDLETMSAASWIYKCMFLGWEAAINQFEIDNDLTECKA